MKTKILSILALLLMAVTGAWADDTYTVQFKANGNTKTVENVVLPYQFRCNFDEENGELDQIIKELYGLSDSYCGGDLRSSGNENVTCGTSGKDDYITISAPFEGTATVTGWYYTYSSGSFDYSLEISIPGYVNPKVNVTGVSLSETTASMTVGGDALTLTATVAPANATDKSVTWSSSNEAVATVTDGVVTAVAAGEATITVTTTDGAKTATCAVTVAAPAASTYTVTLKEGTDDADNWTITPAEATTTGVAAGTTVTATYSGTKKVKSVKAVKKAAVPVTAITLNKTETSIKVGSTETLSVTAVAPDNATDKTYTWKTSDETKATVDQDGKVTAVAAGTVTIYAEANDGSGVKGNCTVTVTPATITVTWNNDDITGTTETSFTKDGVTMNVTGECDFIDKNFSVGTFTSTVGNFTKIEVTASRLKNMGSGWAIGNAENDDHKKTATWTGTASSTVSFGGSGYSDGIWGEDEGVTMVFTIEPTN